MFMGISQDGLHSLEKRVHGLERTVDEMAQDLAVSTGRISTVEDGRATCCNFPGSALLSSNFWRKNEGRYSPAQLATSKGSSMSRSGRGAPYRAEMGTDIWDRKFKGLWGGFMLNPLADVRGTQRGRPLSLFQMTLKGLYWKIWKKTKYLPKHGTEIGLTRVPL